MSPASLERRTNTSCRAMISEATASSSRLAYNRRSVAIWSLRLRPVCSLAPTSPAISVTLRSTAVWMSSSPGSNRNSPASSSAPTWSRAPSSVDTSCSLSRPPLPSPRTWAREPVRSSCASCRATESSVRAGHGSLAAVATLLHRRPRGHAEAPQPYEAFGVLVAEGVRVVVGGQPVVVEAQGAAAAHDSAMPLRFGEEGVQGLLERREPQAVVDQFRPPRLEPDLLVVEVPFKGEVLEVGVGQQQGERPRALVGLTALDPPPTVLHHVEPAEAVRADDPVHLGDQRRRGECAPVHGHRDTGFEGDDQLGRLDSRWTRHRIDVLGGPVPRVLDDPALDGPAPEVLVDRVELLLGHRERDVPLGGVLDAVL